MGFFGGFALRRWTHMKGMAHARGQVLRLDPPQQRLGGVEHEHQRLAVAQHRLDGREMQLHLARVREGGGAERKKQRSHIGEHDT